MSKSDPQQKPTLQLWIAEMRHEMHRKFCQKVLRKSLALDNCALQDPPPSHHLLHCPQEESYMEDKCWIFPYDYVSDLR